MTSQPATRRTTSASIRLDTPKKSATYASAGSSYKTLGAPIWAKWPAGHDREAVGHGERLFLVVRHIQERDAYAFLDRLQLYLEGAPQLCVERSQRLVQEQHCGMEHEGPCEGDPLLLASRQLIDAPLLVAGKLHELQHLADALFDL